MIFIPSIKDISKVTTLQLKEMRFGELHNQKVLMLLFN